MSNSMPPQQPPRYHVGQRVRYIPPDGSSPVEATIDGMSGAPDRPVRYHLLVNGVETPGVEEAQITPIA